MLPEMNDYLPLIPFLASLTVVCGAIIAVQKVLSNHRKSRDKENAKVLATAKEEDALMKAELRGQIKSLEASLKMLESNVEKDFSHMKENYTSEIKNLGDKIEQIRDQLNSQHSQLLAFLTKLVENRD